MITLIGNAHLDPAWMWTMEEGLAAFAATCRSALDRMEETDFFIFTCSSAAHYEFVEQTDPSLFKRIQLAVQQGRWCNVGGWWVEADCNLPSGESFVRQALLGQSYFQEKFGRIARTGYNVDSFGHNANLPQLLKKSGLDSYVFMRPEQEEMQLAASLFRWQAPSGDVVVTYRLPLHYSNHRQNVTEKIAALPAYSRYAADKDWMIFYGVGNHGGGPTIEQIEQGRLAVSRHKSIQFGDPDGFFSKIDTAGLPFVSHELQPHAIGCYSAHSRLKQLNRRAENALLDAEHLAVLAHVVGARVQVTSLTQAWKNVCFNQFHDLIGGVSIFEACEEAITMYEEALAIAHRSSRLSLQGIASAVNTSTHIENLMVFNTCGFARQEIVEFELWHPHASERGELLESVTLMDDQGIPIVTQKIEPSGKILEDRTHFLASVEVPALGWASFGVQRNVAPSEREQIGLSYEQLGNVLTLRCAHWKHEMELPMAVVYDDPSDTWSHGEVRYTKEIGEFKITNVQRVESGPLRAALRISSHYEASTLTMEVFADQSDNVELRMRLNWQENHKLLKLRFQHGLKNPVARYEIPYASIERPIDSAERPGQSWIDVSNMNGSNGLTVITDSKYSYSIDETCLSVTCARSPLYAHHAPPHVIREGERLRYLDQGEQSFSILVCPHTGNWKSIDQSRLSARLHRPLIAHMESKHQGTLPAVGGSLSLDGDSISVGALKEADDGLGIILRAVETKGETSHCSFTFLNEHWESVFSPFEIKSFRIYKNRITQVDLLERTL